MSDDMIMMADDLADCGFLYDPFALDSEIAALCDDAAQWMMMATVIATGLGTTVANGIVAMLPRVHTGYMPKVQRRNVKHRMYRDGMVIRPVGETSGQSWLVRTGAAA